MSEFDQTQLDGPQDQRVRDYLSAELNPQAGRAEERFRQFLQDEAEDRRNHYRIGGRFRGWVFSLAGAALAACLGFLVAGPHLSKHTTTPGTTMTATPVEFPWVEQTVDSQTYDGGTYVDASGNPVRVLHRRQWDRTRWFDQNKQLRAESVVPHDDVVYVKVKTY